MNVHFQMKTAIFRTVLLLSFALTTSLHLLAGEPSGALVGFAASRTWSDQSGKFRIEGRLQFADIKSVRLLKADGLIVTVPLNKMSESDQAFIGGFLAAEKAINASKGSTLPEVENPFAGGEAAPASSSNMSPQQNAPVAAGPSPGGSTEIPKRQAIVSGFRPLTITPGREFWSASAPVSFPRVDFEEVTIRSDVAKPFFASMKILVGGKAGTIVLNSYQEKRGNKDQFGHFAVMNASTGETSGLTQFDQPWKLLAMSADGTRVAAVRIEGFDKGNDLAIFAVQDGRLNVEFQFTAGGGSWDEVMWAAFLTGNRLATISQKNTLTFWELENSMGPKATHRGATGASSNVALTAAGELLAIPLGNSITVLETSQGKMVGCINRDAPANRIAFSSDGKYLAAFHPFTITLYNTHDGSANKTIAVSEGKPDTTIRWFGNHLLVGSVLYDIERAVPMWTYAGNPTGSATLGDYMFAAFGGEKQSSVAVYRIPHPEAIRAADEIDPATAYAIKPGDSVSVLYDLGSIPADLQTEIRDAVAGKINVAGWKLSPNSTNAITVRVEQGKQEEAEYFTQSGFGPMPFFAPPGFGGRRPTGPSETVKYTPWTHSFSIHSETKQVFMSTFVRSAPQNLQSKDNESTQESVSRICQPSASLFSNLVLPPYLLKAEYQGGLGKSTLSAEGLK